MPKMNLHQKQKGFSLIEIMIAMAIGLMLTTMVMNLYLSSKKSSQVQTAAARIQDRMRFIKYILNHELRMSGYRGCTSGQYPKILVSDPSISMTRSDVVQGYNANGNSWLPTLPTSIQNLVKEGTDVITIKKASNFYSVLSQPMADSSDPINVTNVITGLTNNQMVLITDCEDIDLIKITSSNGGLTLNHPTPENTTDELSKSYQIDAKVMPFQINTYFIGDSGRINNQGNAIYALFTQDAYGNIQELLEGIEDLQFLYGIDTTNDQSVNQYSDASVVNNQQVWDQVISIKSLVLLNSIDGVLNSPQTFTFNGSQQTPTDNLLRKSTQSVIQLRNIGLMP